MPGLSVTRTWVDPSTSITWISFGSPSLSEAKAIVVPSGDHAGE
jgi:hypothetical protein